MANLVFTDDPQSGWHTNDYPQVKLTKVSADSDPNAAALAYIFFGHVNIDFDGGPQAYGPPGLDTHDDLANAGDPDGGWYGVAAYAPNDPLVQSGTVQIDTNAPMYKGKYPVVQQAANGDPNPGFYVSSTPHPLGADYLQSSYIDASQIAFGALSGQLAALGVSIGDYGLTIRHNQNLQSAFYFLDKGSTVGYKAFALGESSEKVGTNLGGSGRGNRFNNNFPVSFIVFPGSFTVDPSAPPAISDADLQTALQPLMANLASFDNAKDLVLLMALNETAPPTAPQGASALAAYQAQTNPATPKNFTTILQGLQAFGLGITVAMDDTSTTSGTPDDGSGEGGDGGSGDSTAATA